MGPERLKQVEEIYHAALDIPEKERGFFLKESCGGDDDLRSEIESLLSFENTYDSFIDSPPDTLAAEVLSARENSLLNSRIGRYEIRELLGSGGMGQVYLARDTELGRPVAIKVLPADFASDSERFRRFDQEARLVSALNHPNILTIFEIGSFEGVRLIASEYVEGKPLREILGKGRLEVGRVLDIAIQIAAALEAAHQAKIAHRDIKPENIMVRGDGLVKVLDFGIAKLLRETAGTDLPDTEAAAIVARQQTREGTILGTAFYMSPEQARGEGIDTRTDIWSLGVVIYEMLAGRLPFKGATTSDYIASILRSDPLPLETETEKIPFELQNLVRKSLRKDKDSRYQTIKGLIADLKDLKNEISFSEKLERVDGLERQVTAREEKPGRRDVKTTGEGPEEHFFTKTGTHKKRRFAGRPVWILAILAALLGAGALGWRKLNSSSLPADAFQKMELTKLTFEGLAGAHADISPDGKYIVYVVVNQSKQSLAVRQVKEAGAVEIVPPAEVSYKGVRFAPGGNSIYYTVFERNKGAAMFEIPALGGHPRKILDNAEGVPSFSPDGKTIVFLNGERSLMLADIVGGPARMLAAPVPGSIWKKAIWHPDGNSIIASIFSDDAGRDFLVEISAKDGTEIRRSKIPWMLIAGFEWLADGSGLIVCGRDPEAKQSQIWYLDYPDGEKRRITNDLSSYFGLSLTADNRSMVTVKSERLSNIWLSGEAAGETPHKITFDEGRDEGMSGLAQAPDGRIVYTVRTGDAANLWIVNPDGSGSRQLTFDNGSNYSPAVSPDGRYIVFISTRTGVNLWRMDLDGGNPAAVTNSAGSKGSPRFTPDGKWILYQQTDSDQKDSAWKISPESGETVELTGIASSGPEVSPDGRTFVAGHGKDERGNPVNLALYSIEGGNPLKIFDFPAITKTTSYKFGADGKSLIYRDNQAGRASNLWSQQLDGGAPKQLTFFESGRIFLFNLSNDGKGYILARGNESSDVVMIGNFR